MIGSWITRISDAIFKFLFRFRFRYDIFISYARRDGKEYAVKLRDQLKSLDFFCFLDLDELPAGSPLTSEIKRALGKSATLVLIGTERALLHSPYVKLEVEQFLETGRAVIPIDCEGLLANGAQSELETYAISLITKRDLTWVDETKAALTKATPSIAVADSIDKLFKYTRRNARVRGQWIATGVFILSGSALSLFMIQQKVSALNAATIEADTAKAQAKAEQKRAADAQAEAKQKAAEAAVSADIARKQEAIAKSNAEEAVRQQKLAESNARTAQSQELASYSVAVRQSDPDLSWSLVNEATRRVPTSQAEDAFRQFLLERPMINVLRGHSDYVLSAAYSPDGKFIVTASDDRTARVWNASTAQLVAELKGHSASVSSATYSPDGKFIVTTGDDRTARIYPRVMFMPFDELMELARRLSPRELTPEERERYLHEP